MSEQDEASEIISATTRLNMHDTLRVRMLNARTVYGKWVYLPTNGTAKAIPVIFHFEKQKVVDLVEGSYDPVAREIQALYQIRPKRGDLPKNTDHCYAYKRPCPFFEDCKILFMGEAFLSNIDRQLHVSRDQAYVYLRGWGTTIVERTVAGKKQNLWCYIPHGPLWFDPIKGERK